ncbi:HdaA/DnaA family protein [Acidocella sp.]|uniref:HdaA/DnaA family protein n=1 Tax=Acidocella sp. TaxID=50710 RepID=UPI0018273B5D|nr:chromosomal replication initiator DnaA [Acidocella sp.]NNM56715.1 chromosomal replication initiator DnaA [Acidocella sp.]
MKQLTLPFAETENFSAEDFCAAPSNAPARDWLARPDSWSNGRLVLWGEPGCGKSHLLHIWAAAHGATVINGATLHGLVRPTGPIAVDDADIVLEPQALLHLLNAAAEAHFPALMAARLPPLRQSYRLADLTSRLRAAEAVEIRAPEDELLERLLTRLSADRQLSLSFPVRNFLLLHLPRTAAALREAVARLDRATLGEGKKITRQLAAEILAPLFEMA